MERSMMLAAWVVLGSLRASAGAGEAVPLREANKPGATTRNLVALKAEGQYRPNPAPDAKGTASKPLALRVETRFDFAERVLSADADGSARRVARKVNQAASAINGEVRPSASQVRPDVSILITERREGSIAAFSPGGPLTRQELELVEAAGDPLALAALLPPNAVAVGDRWAVGAEAARSLSGYDALAANRLTATMESLDADVAKIKLSGEVRGGALGGEGTISIEGTCRFDRKVERVDRLEVRRKESRKPGPVEAGLEMTSTLTVDRRAADTPAELTESALVDVPTEAKPGMELLLLVAPDGKYRLLHDRAWHTFWDDARLTVLKRLDRGEVIAQCNISVGPDAGKGRHQDPTQFRDDIRRALGTRFGQLVANGEVEGGTEAEFRYKVDVQGSEGDVNVRWYYYLIANADGDQLLVTFTLTEAQVKQFGDQDLQLVGSLEWK